FSFFLSLAGVVAIAFVASVISVVTEYTVFSGRCQDLFLPLLLWSDTSRNGGCPMTPKDFRRLALSFHENEERAHMNHPDFRVTGKIFATLGYPENGWGMVKLTPVEQETFVKAQPKVFNPCGGAWGRRGCTNVRLKGARRPTLRRALEAAWRLAAPKSLTHQFDKNR